MNEQAVFTLRGRNPDVLTCIANLSNDEVFTPPDFANRMLDTLAEAWARNNGSLRAVAPREMKTGFGWIQAKPACSMAPVAVTPDELGPAWRDARFDKDA